ncbi:MAG: nicotinate phosphoribosyltransferase [Gemmatimonas sp.]
MASPPDIAVAIADANWANSLLLTDLYQLNMAQAYVDRIMTQPAAFEFFVRKLPSRRGFLLAAGLEQVLQFLERLRFTREEIEWLASTGRFRPNLLDYLAKIRFDGDVDAMPEGTAFFQDEPILRVVAPLPVAQLVETRIINLLHFETLVASKAARVVLSAPGKLLVDFGLRRAHGAEAGLLAARAAYIAGFAGTATTAAGREFGIPIYGTMAHSFIQAFDGETAAFEAFARSRPEGIILLIDTYDTEAAAHKVASLVPRLAADGIRVRGVRLDSGDLATWSRHVRRILDRAGLHDVTIFASGGLDEDIIADLLRLGAPIDGFGVGTSLTTSSDVPSLDCAYKLQEYAGRARRKRSQGKATWPGRKQVWRRFDNDGRMCGDLLAIDGEAGAGTSLLQPVMRAGRRIAKSESLADIRKRSADELSRLPAALRLLRPMAYQLDIAPSLERLAGEVDRSCVA